MLNNFFFQFCSFLNKRSINFDRFHILTKWIKLPWINMKILTFFFQIFCIVKLFWKFHKDFMIFFMILVFIRCSRCIISFFLKWAMSFVSRFYNFSLSYILAMDRKKIFWSGKSFLKFFCLDFTRLQSWIKEKVTKSLK